MEPLGRPSQALLAAQSVADEESQQQRPELVPGYHYGPPWYFTILSLLRKIGALGQVGPLLDFILRRQVKAAQTRRTHTRVQPARESNKDVSEDAEQPDQSAKKTEEEKRAAEHKRRIEALIKELEPLSSEDGSAVVLLCWGEKSSCSIMPVPVAHPEDEVATWTELNNAWYARRGDWRKRLPWYGIKSVDIAKITILGPKNASNQLRLGEYIGMYPDNIATTDKEGLLLDIERCVPILRPGCSYDGETGMAKCDRDCNCSRCEPNSEDAEECPIEILSAAKRGLVFHTLHMMSQVFSNPVLAVSNDFLKRGNLVYSHQDILREINCGYHWHCPGLREIEFRGLVITEGWIVDTRHVVLPLGATIFLGVVMVAKLLFDWSTAWNVGSFFVALVALLWMWAIHMTTR